MVLAFKNMAELTAHGFDALIDVRSPAEYQEDHIPGAINLPALSNEERARVGTIYTGKSAFLAKKVGAAMVARNVADHLDGPLAEYGGGWRPLVYCWRGGQRSGSFATILKQIGWRAEVIEGGYRTYRRLVSHAMYDDDLGRRLVVLEGNTGTAKTDLLHLLATRGQQVVDLEGLAAHRGSVFGRVARPQPSQKSFEGALANAFAVTDHHRPVIVEAESSKIGKLLIPPAVWKAMKSAPRIRVTAPLNERAKYLTRAYDDIAADREGLIDTLSALIRHQGHERVEYWQGLVQNGDMVRLAAELMEFHYDPSYARSRGVRTTPVIGEVASDDLTPDGLVKSADQLLGLLQGISDQV